MLTAFLIVVALMVAAAIWLRPPEDKFELLSPPSGTHRTHASDAAAKAEETLRQLQQTIDGVPWRHRLRRARELLNQGIFGLDIQPDTLGIDVISVEIDGLAAEWLVSPDATSNHRILFLHGGAFALGSPRSHRHLAADLARNTGYAVLSIDYRLMPEHSRRAAFDDALKAYHYAREHGPTGREPAHALFVGGDSAGGALTLSLIQHVKATGLPPFNAAFALSPQTDSTGVSASMRRHIATDPMLGPHLGLLTRLPYTLGRLLVLAAMRHRPDNPLISPLHGDLANLPPTLIHASTAEMLFDDACRYYSKAQAAGSPVQLETWPQMLHVWQLFGRDLPEAAESLDKIAAFLKSHRS